MGRRLVRAERRYRDLKATDDRVTYDQVLAEVTARDMRDSTRAVAPLVPAKDAVSLDTTGMTANTGEVCSKMKMKLTLANLAGTIRAC
jgi:CMP/dCMP kinase